LELSACADEASDFWRSLVILMLSRESDTRVSSLSLRQDGAVHKEAKR
jgi:hypothetical protein